MTRVAITATGSYTPAQVITNDELVERFDLSVDSAWIVDRTGVESRHWLEPGETTSDMAVRAAQRCLDRAGVAPAELDRIILATVSPDLPSPSTATIVARKLGARCMAFDLSAACSGFLYGLDLGAASILAGARRVLVIGADARSRFLDPNDHRGLVLFADGAGCALLERSHDATGLLGIECCAEGLESMGVYIPAGGAQRPASAETVANGEHYMRIDPKGEIFALFLKFTREICRKALERAELRVEDIDLFIPHQGNGNLVKLAAKELGFDPSVVVDDVAMHGNTAGASVAIALDEARASGRIRSGSKVLMTAAGAGCTFAAAVHRF
jgi:3-oxoacyl-[acyl-carrier-protein] synthase III